MWRTVLVSIVSAVAASILTMVVGWAAVHPSPVEAQSSVLRARAFELLNDNGQVIGSWASLQGGGQTIDMTTPQGTLLARLATFGDNGSALLFGTPAGQLRMVVGTRPNGSRGLFLFDDAGNLVANYE